MAPNSVADLPKARTHKLPAVAMIKDRVDNSESRAANLEIDAGRMIVSYASKEDGDILNETQFVRSGENITGTVRRVTLTLPAGNRLTCEFGSMTASGQTSAQFPIAEITRSALPILMRLDRATTSFLGTLAEHGDTTSNPDQAEIDFDE